MRMEAFRRFLVRGVARLAHPERDVAVFPASADQATVVLEVVDPFVLLVDGLPALDFLVDCPRLQKRLKVFVSPVHYLEDLLLDGLVDHSLEFGGFLVAVVPSQFSMV